MTPQEKAKQLVNRFLFADIYFTDKHYGAYRNAKQCALIAVDELVEHDIDIIEYWQQVQQEIEKL